MFSCEFCEISKNTFSYRTPSVAASAQSIFAATPNGIRRMAQRGLAVVMKHWAIEFSLIFEFIVRSVNDFKLPRILDIFRRRCSVKKGVLKILQNSQENTYPRVSFWIKLQVSLPTSTSPPAQLNRILPGNCVPYICLLHFCCKFFNKNV